MTKPNRDALLVAAECIVCGGCFAGVLILLAHMVNEFGRMLPP